MASTDKTTKSGFSAAIASTFGSNALNAVMGAVFGKLDN